MNVKIINDGVEFHYIDGMKKNVRRSIKTMNEVKGLNEPCGGSYILHLKKVY